MKKLINDPRIVVREMLEGQVGLHAGQTLLADENVVLRADLGLPAARQVAIISGGGSGHEPAHAGYVGAGMLHAAVAGDVFTSPSTDAVLAAIRAAAGPAGALLIVKNYTGDRLNFGLAAELARAEGIPVETVVVADDVALRDTVASERRRGLAGTVLVHKVAGAASAAGLDLAAVAAEARQAASAVGTMGVALGACTVPGGMWEILAENVLAALLDLDDAGVVLFREPRQNTSLHQRRFSCAMGAMDQHAAIGENHFAESLGHLVAAEKTLPLVHTIRLRTRKRINDHQTAPRREIARPQSAFLASLTMAGMIRLGPEIPWQNDPRSIGLAKITTSNP